MNYTHQFDKVYFKCVQIASEQSRSMTFDY